MKDISESDTYAELPFAVILTAIPCEFSSISNFLIDKSTKKLPSGIVYTEGFYQTNYGKLKIALFETGAGNIEAAVKTSEVVPHLNPNLIIFSGIAGGLKDVKIGDVVASSKVSYYEAGKADIDFLPRNKSYSVYPKVLEVAKSAARNSIPLEKFKGISNTPRVFVEPIISGEKVLANTKSPYYEQIKRNHSDALAVEMEGYGVLKVATENKKDAIVIRGISDLVDGKSKADAFGSQEVASKNAALFTFHFLEQYFKNRACDTVEDQNDEEQVLKTGNVLAELGRASSELLHWPKTLDGKIWLEREEEDSIYSIIESEPDSTILILGEPGSGKSAFLSKIASDLIREGKPVLAIKADLVDENVSTFPDLARHLGITGDLITHIKNLANDNAVYIFIDQLDALADLVDLHTKRLNLFINFIHTCRDIKGVHIISSCRNFEFRHDVRLTTIEAHEIQLTLPSWEKITEALKALGIEAGSWPESFREILRNPQHLKVFFQLSKESKELKVFDSYQKMLEEVWRKKILPSTECSQLVSEISSEMSKKEILWIPEVKYSDRYDLIEQLIASGILTRSESGTSIGFRHQTLFDHARSREFAGGKESLSDYVIARQDALFVRPTLWSALTYLRGASKKAYLEEFSKLWENPSIREHLKVLLIEFLGQVKEPEEIEKKWLLGYFSDSKYLKRILKACTGNEKWYEILSQNHLEVLMENHEDSISNYLVQFLAAAWNFDKSKNLEILKNTWLKTPQKDNLTWNVLTNITKWDENAIELISTILSRTEFHLSSAIDLASIVSAHQPHLTPKVVKAMLVNTPESQFKKVLESTTGMYDLPAIAEASPLAYLQEVWPFFVDIIRKASRDVPSHINEYPSDYSIATKITEDQKYSREFYFVEAIKIAIKEYAIASPEDYINFVGDWKNEELLSIQRLLLYGLLEIVGEKPNECFNFLLEDHRRFALGDYSDKFIDTKKLISALVPHLSGERLLELENAIKRYQYYSGDPDNSDIKTRFERKKWARIDRLRLLRAIPLEKMTPQCRKHCSEEERAFPGISNERVRSFEVRSIGSPMSKEQMSRAKDSDILNLFEKLPDKTEWDHYKHIMKGGSIQASRELAEFAKENPKRALSLIMRMSVDKHERPVAHVIRVIPEDILPNKDLFKLIKQFDARGFKSVEFMTDAAHAICERLKKSQSGFDEILTLLKNWLEFGWDFKHVDGPEQGSSKEGSEIESILWGMRGIEILPQGTFNVLEAIFWGYNGGDTPSVEPWLDILNKHLERPESSKVWRSYSHYLKCLFHGDKKSGIIFLKNLFAKYPDVQQSIHGVYLIAHIHFWLPDDVFHSFIEEIRDSSWDLGFQSYGELLFIRKSVKPDDKKASMELEKILPLDVGREGITGSLLFYWKKLKLRFIQSEIKSNNFNHNILRGVAYSAAYLWRELKYRDICTDTILRLIPIADKKMSVAILSTFTILDDLPIDKRTLDILNKIVIHPNILNENRVGKIIDLMQDLIPLHNEVVYKLSKLIIEKYKTELVDMRLGLPYEAGGLVDIALTLQRQEGNERLWGVELFEKLLAIDYGMATNAIIEIDSRPVNVSQAIRRRRNTRKRKRG